MALLLAVTGAPSAQADSFDASFTCTSACVSLPTDPPVSFPSPIIPISFFSESFTITLNAFDNPADTFTWGIGSTGSNWYFEINDVTNGRSDDGPSFSFGPGNSAPYGSGCVNFSQVAMPEPSSIALLLLGVGIVFVSRKRIRQGFHQAT